MAERTRQHREMRVKGSAALRDKLEELKSKLHDEKERMQKEFEDQVREGGLAGDGVGRLRARHGHDTYLLSSVQHDGIDPFEIPGCA